MVKSIKNKIIILGFGRSGTPWLSDIISKTLGGLILFEPLHPKVLSNSKEIAYSKINEDKQSLQLIKHLNNVLENNNRSDWLLRNHIPYKIEEMGQDYFNLIWDYCRIIGFKSIRANHMIEWIYHNISKDIIFVTRHPSAVIASILRREKNGHKFWEFGWPRTYEIFINNTIYFIRCNLKKINYYFFDNINFSFI